MRHALPSEMMLYLQSDGSKPITNDEWLPFWNSLSNEESWVLREETTKFIWGGRKVF